MALVRYETGMSLVNLRVWLTLCFTANFLAGLGIALIPCSVKHYARTWLSMFCLRVKKPNKTKRPPPLTPPARGGEDPTAHSALWGRTECCVAERLPENCVLTLWWCLFLGHFFFPDMFFLYAKIGQGRFPQSLACARRRRRLFECVPAIPLRWPLPGTEQKQTPVVQAGAL